MSHLATVGILSIGDMGMAVAKLLMSQGYRVVTNLEGRRWDEGFLFGLRLLFISYLNFVFLGTK